MYTLGRFRSWQTFSQKVSLLKPNISWRSCVFYKKHPAAAAEAELVLAE